MKQAMLWNYEEGETIFHFLRFCPFFCHYAIFSPFLCFKISHTIRLTIFNIFTLLNYEASNVIKLRRICITGISFVSFHFTSSDLSSFSLLYRIYIHIFFFVFLKIILDRFWRSSAVGEIVVRWFHNRFLRLTRAQVSKFLSILSRGCRYKIDRDYTFQRERDVAIWNDLYTGRRLHSQRAAHCAILHDAEAPRSLDSSVLQTIVRYGAIEPD